MKLLKNLSLALLMTVLLVGCSKDDDSQSASLIGSWKISSQILNDQTLPLDECEMKSTITFDANNVTVKEYDGENCEDLEIEVIPYTRNGDTLIVGTGEDKDEVKILKLTQSTLEIEHRDGMYVLVQKYTRL